MEQRESIPWERIENFIGFGRRDAPVVFIGMEEGLECADELDRDLAIRSTYPTAIIDLKEAFCGLPDAERYFDPERAPRQPTWRVMADLMLRREAGCADCHPATQERKSYRALQLGRSDGETLLAELLPYPHPKIADWLYGRFGRYATREAYMQAMLPRRRLLLRDMLRQFQRDLIVCYGKAHWPHYERLFDAVPWRDDAPFRIGEMGATRIVLATHFSARGFSTNDQLARFAAVALAQCSHESRSHWPKAELRQTTNAMRTAGATTH